jgi:hypothetical protein
MLWLKQSHSELLEDSVISILETTASDGKNYSTKFWKIKNTLAILTGLFYWKTRQRNCRGIVWL